jgi:hypothetical protein
MFDGLQEGIIVIDDNKLSFMNDLSNKLLSELADMKNFFKNKNKEHGVPTPTEDPLDRKLFFLFEHDKSEGTSKEAKKRKYGSQSDHSKHSTD